MLSHKWVELTSVPFAVRMHAHPPRAECQHLGNNSLSRFWQVGHGNLSSKHTDFEEWLISRDEWFLHNCSLLIIWRKYCLSQILQNIISVNLLLLLLHNCKWRIVFVQPAVAFHTVNNCKWRIVFSQPVAFHTVPLLSCHVSWEFALIVCNELTQEKQGNSLHRRSIRARVTCTCLKLAANIITQFVKSEKQDKFIKSLS